MGHHTSDQHLGTLSPIVPSVGVVVSGKRYYLHSAGTRSAIRSYGYIGNAVSQFTTIMNAPADAVHGGVFYLGDGAIDSALWLDEFSFQLTGLRTRRAPAWVLNLLARGG